MSEQITDGGEDFAEVEVVESKTLDAPETISSSVIKFENDTIRGAFESFVRNYKGNIESYLNMVLSNDGVPVDAFISTEGDSITVYQQAPNKGIVLAMVGDALNLGAYLDVEDEGLYGIVENGSIFLYYKQPKGTPDVKLGQFKTLSDAVKDWKSESVTKRVDEVKEYLVKQKSARENGVKKLD